MLSFIHKYRFEAVNFVAGAVVLTFELVATRVAAPYIGTTIYTWTSIIGVILAALAAGYWYGGYLADKRKRAEDVILLLMIAAGLIFIINLIKDWLLYQISQTDLPLQIQAFGASLLLFAPPAVALGAVSPYLARLSLTGLGTSGRHIARISAAGTIGSLVGTFLTGYLLFGFIGTRNILSVLVLFLVLGSFLLTSRFILIPRILLGSAAFLSLVISPNLHLTGVVSDIDTHYQRLAVRDTFFHGRPVRILQTDALAWQSGIYRDGDDGLAFPYIRAFSYLAASAQPTDDYLAIGGGAFTLPQYLAEKYPRSNVDVVEIDDRLKQVSSSYFNFKPLDNLHIIEADGRQFLNNNKKVYDLIFVDTFDSITPPFQMLTKEAVGRIGNSLKPEGVVAVNVVSAYQGPKAEFIEAVYKTYLSSFKSVLVFPVYNADAYRRQNLLLCTYLAL